MRTRDGLIEGPLRSYELPSLGPPERGQLADRREKVIAGLLATVTDLGANTAMLMVGGMALALLRAGEAGRRTGFDDGADDAEIGLRLARHDAASGLARVGAIEAEPNATHHLLHVALDEIGVRTARTAGSTVEALSDTAQDSVVIQACRAWMQLDDLLKGHVLSFRSGSQRGDLERSSATVSSAVGTTSRRSSGIGAPLSIERP